MNEKLDKAGIEEYLDSVSGWVVAYGNSTLEKNCKFDTFGEAMDVVNQVAKIAEEERHHPEIEINYRNVTFRLSTHDVKGLSKKDFILAGRIDKCLSDK